MTDGRFTLDDMLCQFRLIRTTGIGKTVFAMMPGMREFAPDAQDLKCKFERYETILSSMSEDERADAGLFEDDPVRRSNVAKRSGTSEREVADVLRLYCFLRKLADKHGGLVRRRAFRFPDFEGGPQQDCKLN